MSRATIGELGRRDTLRAIAGALGGAAGVNDSREDDGFIAGLTGPKPTPTRGFLFIKPNERYVLRSNERETYNGILWGESGELVLEDGAELDIKET